MTTLLVNYSSSFGFCTFFLEQCFGACTLPGLLCPILMDVCFRGPSVSVCNVVGSKSLCLYIETLGFFGSHLNSVLAFTHQAITMNFSDY